MALWSVGSVLGFVFFFFEGSACLLGLSQDLEHVGSLNLRNTGVDCLSRSSIVGPRQPRTRLQGPVSTWQLILLVWALVAWARLARI